MLITMILIIATLFIVILILIVIIDPLRGSRTWNPLWPFHVYIIRLKEDTVMTLQCLFLRKSSKLLHLTMTFRLSVLLGNWFKLEWFSLRVQYFELLLPIDRLVSVSNTKKSDDGQIYTQPRHWQVAINQRHFINISILRNCFDSTFGTSWASKSFFPALPFSQKNVPYRYKYVKK